MTFGFKFYIKPLASTVHKYKNNGHLQADEAQLYIPFNLNISKDAMDKLET